MGKGKPYSTFDRNRIADWHLNRGDSPEMIWNRLFYDDPSVASLRYIKDLCAMFRAQSCEQRQEYLRGPKGKNRIMPMVMDGPMKALLLDIASDNPGNTARQTYKQFNVAWFGGTRADEANYIPEPTLYRYLTKYGGLSRKVMERRHFRANPILELAWWRKVAPFDPTRFKDIDECSISPKAFESRYGYAPVGRPALRTQIFIGTRSFSVICIVGYEGVEAWKVHEGMINGEIFETFITDHVAPIILAGDYGILDNAAIHKTESCLASLEFAFQGFFSFCPPYTPWVKPVELVFALAKRFLRANEIAALADPEYWINLAFERYSLTGTQRGVIKQLWLPYILNSRLA